MTGDDPALLRLIADNLEIALKDTDARLALKPEQGTLLLAAVSNPAEEVAALPSPKRLRAVSGT